MNIADVKAFQENLAKQIEEDYPEKADEILGTAMTALDARFGEGLSVMVKENAAQDFTAVADYKGI